MFSAGQVVYVHHFKAIRQGALQPYCVMLFGVVRVGCTVGVGGCDEVVVWVGFWCSGRGAGIVSLNNSARFDISLSSYLINTL